MITRKKKFILSFILLILVGLIYVLFPSSVIDGGHYGFCQCSDAAHFRQTKSLADTGKADMAHTFQLLPGDTAFVDGRQYPNKPIGTSLSAVPFYYLGEQIADFYIAKNNNILDAKLNADKIIALNSKEDSPDHAPVVAWSFSVKDSSLSRIGLALSYTSLEKKPAYSLIIKIVPDHNGYPDPTKVIGEPQSITAGQIVLGLGKYTPVPYQAELEPDRTYWLVVQVEENYLDYADHDLIHYLITAGRESPEDYGLKKNDFNSDWESLDLAPFMVLESDNHVVPTLGAKNFRELPFEIYTTELLSLVAAVFSVFLVFLILHQVFRLSFSASWLSALIMALGTEVWRYSSFLYVHDLSLFLCLLSLYLALMIGIVGKKKRRWYLAAGLVAGYAILVDYTNFIVVLGLVIYLFSNLLVLKKFRRGMLNMLFYILGMTPFGAGIAIYQAIAFGSPLASSYKYYPDPIFLPRQDWFSVPHWKNILIMFFGFFAKRQSMDGILVAVPIIVLGMVGLFIWWRRDRLSAILIAGLILAILIFGSFFMYVSGGGTYDYRYLLTPVALLFLPLGFFIDRFICNRLARSWNLAVHAIFWILAVATIYWNITHMEYLDIFSRYLFK